MPTTWAATASNQLVTRQALQDAINTGAIAWNSTFIPNTDINKTITYGVADTYARIPFLSGSSSRVIPKSLYEGMAYIIATGGKRDGANLTLYVLYSGGGAYTQFLTTSTCTISGSSSSTVSGTGTIFITTGGFGDPRVKFYLADGGISCPISGTKYNDYVVTTPLTRNYNFLITPVWDGIAYEMV